MYSDMYPPLLYHTQHFTALKALYGPPGHPSRSNHSSFTVSSILPFPNYLTVGIIQYVAFSDWHLSLSHMHLSFLHVFS